MTTITAPDSTLLAAIDAGSNGLRFAIGRVDASGALIQLEHMRESVRLGADTFTTGVFSENTLQAAVGAFSRFAGLIKVNGITHYRAVATSAARDASNGALMVSRILEETGIRLEIIDGLEEARLVFGGVSAAVDLHARTALLIDMGGGSIAITIARDAVIVTSETFPLGGVRLLSQLRAAGQTEADVETRIAPLRAQVSELIQAKRGGRGIDICVATGGNPERLGRLRATLVGKNKVGKIKLSDLDAMIDAMMLLTPEQRVEKLEMRPDRADVIVVAAIVLRAILRDAGITKAITPNVGVAQGLLQQLAAGLQRAPDAQDRPQGDL
jgi:exopolyphosphatase/guanosine-5'-triphosphate,3'-diphosphate pyrophosphatase